MKIRDIIIKIANREDVPKRIKWRDKIWIYNNKDQDYTNNDDYLLAYNFCNHRTLDFINDEVEIIEVEIIEEEKEIEQTFAIELLGQCDNWLQRGEGNIEHGLELNPYILDAITRNFKLLYHKQTELIDVVNEMRKEK